MAKPLGTTNLRNLWYGFVKFGGKGRVTAKLKEHDFYEVGKVQVLWTWLDGPNRVRWIFGHCGKIPESLAVIKPGLLYR